jgi:hypothetical protein
MRAIMHTTFSIIGVASYCWVYIVLFNPIGMVGQNLCIVFSCHVFLNVHWNCCGIAEDAESLASTSSKRSKFLKASGLSNRSSKASITELNTRSFGPNSSDISDVEMAVVIRSDDEPAQPPLDVLPGDASLSTIASSSSSPPSASPSTRFLSASAARSDHDDGDGDGVASSRMRPKSVAFRTPTSPLTLVHMSFCLLLLSFLVFKTFWFCVCVCVCVCVYAVFDNS